MFSERLLRRSRTQRILARRRNMPWSQLAHVGGSPKPWAAPRPDSDPRQKYKKNSFPTSDFDLGPKFR